MAVYTHITNADLAAHLARYDLGALKSFEGIAEGVSNTNYFIDTDRGRHILTLFEARVAAKDLPFCLGFMEHLRRGGIPAAALVTDKTGEKFPVLAGRPSAITTFLPGKSAKIPTAAQCAGMGGMLARMHLAARDFKMTRDNAMGLAEWKRLLSLCKGKSDIDLDAEIAFLEKHPWDTLPRGAVHADVFPDNVFFEGNKISGVIDFYFSCTDAFAYDLMLTLNAWCFAGGALDVAKSSAFLGAYTAARPLSQAETAALPLLGRAAALRIVATRLYDLLHPSKDALVTPKDPREHLDILRFHAGASAETYGLAA